LIPVHGLTRLITVCSRALGHVGWVRLAVKKREQCDTASFGHEIPGDVSNTKLRSRVKWEAARPAHTLHPQPWLLPLHVPPHDCPHSSVGRSNNRFKSAPRTLTLHFLACAALLELGTPPGAVAAVPRVPLQANKYTSDDSQVNISWL